MIVLGILTSGPVGAAIVGGPREAAIAGTGQALSSLLDCVTGALAQTELSLSEVQGVAVCTGPGSFTGLRIGVAFAAALAQARDLPCIGVSTYDVAEAGSRALYPHAAIVAGKRGYYYARLRAAADAEPQFARGDAAEIAVAVEAMAREAGRPVAMHGEGAVVNAPRAGIIAGGSMARGPAELARAVALAGAAALASGAPADWRRVAIDYGQRPNAEINWETRRARP